MGQTITIRRLDTNRFFPGIVNRVSQGVAVENDETHWVGHDFRMDPSKLRQGFRLSLPMSVNRTETVDKDETITIHMNRTESISFQNMLYPGAILPALEFSIPTQRGQGLRLEGIKVHNAGVLPDGGRWADVTAKSIIAILIGL